MRRGKMPFRFETYMAERGRVQGLDQKLVDMDKLQYWRFLWSNLYQ